MYDHQPLTFFDLTTMSNKELDLLFMRGKTPTLVDMVGFEFKGWNNIASTKLTATQKFKKGFFGDPSQGHAWGYNMPVEQNSKNGAWHDKMRNGRPIRYFFFKAFPAGANDSIYPHSLVVNYAKSGEYFFLNPAGFTVDYLVFPDESNRAVLLGKAYFEFGPIKHFAGYFILERQKKSEYVRKSHFLNTRQMRTVEAFSDVFINNPKRAISPEEVAWNIDAQLARIRSKRTQSLILLLFVVEYLLAPFRCFSKMSRAQRRELIETKLRNPGGMRFFRSLARDLSRIRVLFLAGYYGDKRVQEDIKFIPPERRSWFASVDSNGRRTSEVKLHEPESTVIDTDICVIGSGAGGAVVAYNAAASGERVVLLEEGAHKPQQEMTHNEGKMTAELYKEGGLQNTVDFDMTILQGKCLGGTTVINNAICFRMKEDGVYRGDAPDTLDVWRKKLKANIDESKLNEAYARVEKFLGIQPITKEIAGPNANVLMRGWENLLWKNEGNPDYKYDLFRKNLNGCLGCGYCNFGCPYDRKFSMLESYIPAAIEHGAKVIPGTHAVKIETANGHAVGVTCQRKNGKKLFVRANHIVLSCGAIGSSVLLLKSGIRRNVGSRFSFNAGTLMLAEFDRTINGFDGVQMASYLDTGDFLLESHFDPPMAFGMTMPGWFEPHYERMQNYSKFASMGVLIGTEANGKVKKLSFLRNLLGPVKYQMTRSDLQKMKSGMVMAAKIFFAAGAKAVYPSSLVDVEMRSPDEVEARIDQEILRPDDLVLNSSHPQGGNPMSDNPSIGVVDSELRVHGYENLYVCDASVFPTTIRVNPQLTIMAMADYFCHLRAWKRADLGDKVKVVSDSLPILESQGYTTLQ